MEAFHFLRPWWLFALVPWLLLSWHLWRSNFDRDAWRTVCDEALLPFILEGGAPGRKNAGILLLALAGMLAIVALAGPTWRELPQPVYRQQEALVVVLDLSRSMDAADMKPNRLAHARLKVRDLIQQRRDGQTALVVFAGDAFAVTPLTDDVNTIDALVPSLTTDLMPVLGTRTDRALDVAAALLEQAGARRGRVVLITDDAGSTGLDAAVARLTEAGHRLSVIGAGTPDGAPIPAADGDFVKDATGQIIIPRLTEPALRSLARAGNGSYARLSVDDRDLAQVLGGGAPGWSSVTDVPGLTSDRWREEGPWLLLLVLPVASLAFRRGLLALAMTMLLPFPDPAAALDWGTPWHNDNQRGAQAFQAQDYGRAVEAFRDPEWKAAGLYRAGRFEQAAAMLESLRHANALYNRGNALARLGKFEAAMEQYEQVLRTEPGHDDARYNLELLRQREPPPPPPDRGRGQDSDSGQPSPRDSDSSSSGNRQDSDTSPPHDGDEPKDSGAGDASRDADGSTQVSSSQTPDRDPEQAPTTAREKSAAEPSEADAPPASAGDDLSESADESRQAMKQWLRRIPDDPAGLLRRKFRYQYSRRAQGKAAETKPW
ncbi:MAG: VWA domain-containing protein [Gammaproteobacteria bacterium]|nr:VWA domain-containing protein [Gammaproteobacteria bacterium]